ncbi:MAG: hypothetical protein RI894_2055 [Bacteroidota bacterium]|jgi:competence ComEA-like helix-hairpin-helix protein
MKNESETPIIDFLHYTKQERIGVIALLLLIVLCAILPHLSPLFLKQEKTDFTAYQEEIQQFKASLQEADEVESSGGSAKTYANKTPVSLFNFDPNTASEADFIKLGLSPKTAGTILKYRSKGGKFRTPDDFGKIYSIHAEQFAQLKPYIQIAETGGFKKDFDKKGFDKKQFDKSELDKKGKLEANLETFAFDPNTASEADLLRLLPPKTVQSIVNYRSKGGKFKTKDDVKKIYTLAEADFTRLESSIAIAAPTASTLKVTPYSEKMPSALAPTTNAAFSKSKKTQNKVDINAATAEDFQQLPSVGIGYATRIVNTREKFGGFVKVEQLKETYGLPDSIYQKILPQLQLGTPTTRKLKINSATADDLKKHPYLNWKLANLIVSFREQHGRYKSATDLKQIPLITPEIFDKIAGYIGLD